MPSVVKRDRWIRKGDFAKEDQKGIRFVQGNACDFALAEPVDVVFSNAVFHWIDEGRQPDMLRCVYRALKPGGQFVFEMGGKRGQ